MFLFLPDGEDPDSLVRQEGVDGFDARLRDATPLSEFFYASLSTDVNLSSLDGKARLAERCKPLLAQIPDGAFGDLMQQRLTELTGGLHVVNAAADNAGAGQDRAVLPPLPPVADADGRSVLEPKLAARGPRELLRHYQRLRE